MKVFMNMSVIVVVVCVIGLGWMEILLKYKKTQSTVRLKFPLYLEHVRPMDIAVSHLSSLRYQCNLYSFLYNLSGRAFLQLPSESGYDGDIVQHSCQ